MGPHDYWSHHHWQDIGVDVLQRVRVDGHNTDWCCPLMVHLVKVFVQFGVVRNPKR